MLWRPNPGIFSRAYVNYLEQDLLLAPLKTNTAVL